MSVMIKWNPTDDIFVLDETISQVLGRISHCLQKRKTAEASSAWAPIADMYETEEAFTLHVELAGIEKESVEILFQEGYLAIRGKRSFNPQMQSAKIHRIERMYGVFQRTFGIPAPIETKEITASYDHGVLKISLPKVQRPDVDHVKIPITFT